MTSHIPFQKLFDTFDEQCGIGLPFVPKQSNTREIDRNIQAIREQQIESLTNKFNHNNDFNKLRNLIHRIPEMKFKSGNVLKIHKSSHPISIQQESKVNLQTIDSYNIYHAYDWEREVIATMQTNNDNLTDEDTESIITITGNMNQSKDSMYENENLLRPYLKEIAPYFCFYPDSIEIDNIQDDFNKLIPNPIFEEDELEDEMNNMTETELISVKPLSTFLSIEESNKSSTKKTSKVIIDSTNVETLAAIDSIAAKSSITGNKKLTTKEKKQALAFQKASRLRDINLGSEAAEALDEIFSYKRGDDFATIVSKQRGRSAVVSLRHALIALLHQNTRCDLRESELKYFHRPHVKPSKEFIIQFDSKKHKEKVSTNNLKDNSNQSTSNNQSLSLLEGDYFLMEYIEESPPIIQNIGMSSAILNYYRPPKGDVDDHLTTTIINEEMKDMDDDNPGLTIDLKKKQTRDKFWSLANTYRLPRHLKLMLQFYENKDNKLNNVNLDTHIPHLELGETMCLASDEESPFLGNIEEGQVYPAMVNNLFRTLLFKHQHISNTSNVTVKTIDFLLVAINDRNNFIYQLRRLPKDIFLCSQQEPLKVVPKPNIQVSKVQERFYLLHIVNLLQKYQTDGMLT